MFPILSWEPGNQGSGRSSFLPQKRLESKSVWFDFRLLCDATKQKCPTRAEKKKNLMKSDKMLCGPSKPHSTHPVKALPYLCRYLTFVGSCTQAVLFSLVQPVGTAHLFVIIPLSILFIPGWLCRLSGSWAEGGNVLEGTEEIENRNNHLSSY